jgi:hypothetical protein
MVSLLAYTMGLAWSQIRDLLLGHATGAKAQEKKSPKRSLHL